MPLFQYRALQADGAFAEGELEASGRQDAFRQIQGLGLRLVKLDESTNGPEKKGLALPKYLRAKLYEYHFTTSVECRLNGQWWWREDAGDYVPEVALKQE